MAARNPSDTRGRGRAWQLGFTACERRLSARTEGKKGHDSSGQGEYYMYNMIGIGCAVSLGLWVEWLGWRKEKERSGTR